MKKSSTLTLHTFLSILFIAVAGFKLGQLILIVPQFPDKILAIEPFQTEGTKEKFIHQAKIAYEHYVLDPPGNTGWLIRSQQKNFAKVLDEFVENMNQAPHGATEWKLSQNYNYDISQVYWTLVQGFGYLFFLTAPLFIIGIVLLKFQDRWLFIFPVALPLLSLPFIMQPLTGAGGWEVFGFMAPLLVIGAILLMNSMVERKAARQTEKANQFT